MARLIGGTFAGVIGWFVIVTILNIALRHGWPDYALVEKAMTFTLPMMIVRLTESALGSLASGALAAAIDRSRAPLAGGILLLLIFAPEHYMLWHHFPLWYHLTFLTSLPLLGWAGGRLVRQARI